MKNTAKLQRKDLKRQPKVYFKCKWCGKSFVNKWLANNHAIACGIEFEIKELKA